jgi:hypothetical protein
MVIKKKDVLSLFMEHYIMVAIGLISDEWNHLLYPFLDWELLVNTIIYYRYLHFPATFNFHRMGFQLQTRMLD